MKETPDAALETPRELTSDEVKLPASRKIYIETNGSTVNRGSHKLRVPFREITLAPSKDISGTLEENPPVRVYDTSGPWTDPDVHCNVHDGLPALRREWIVARGDVEESEAHAFTSETNSADARHEFTPKGVT